MHKQVHRSKHGALGAASPCLQNLGMWLWGFGRVYMHNFIFKIKKCSYLNFVFFEIFPSWQPMKGLGVWLGFLEEPSDLPCFRDDHNLKIYVWENQTLMKWMDIKSNFHFWIGKWREIENSCKSCMQGHFNLLVKFMSYFVANSCIIHDTFLVFCNFYRRYHTEINCEN